MTGATAAERAEFGARLAVLLHHAVDAAEPPATLLPHVEAGIGSPTIGPGGTLPGQSRA